MTRIVLHVDRLVLRGVDAADAPAVTQALQAELQRLLAADGAAALAAHGGTAVLRAGRVALPAGAGAATLGRAAAVPIVHPAAARREQRPCTP
ncbi:hypothetical protein [Pseudorhodoferax sp.]|uniref:hypothetical protein n=1 Tax=Pseudorhodoferax sp. TaxID=1993553 RepID=UPI0039E50811